MLVKRVGRPGLGHESRGLSYVLLCAESEASNMKPAGSASLDSEQIKFRSQLAVAVDHINEADELLVKNTNSEAANHRAIALLLSALGRVLVLETAEKYGMSTRLPAFKHQPK